MAFIWLLDWVVWRVCLLLCVCLCIWRNGWWRDNDMEERENEKLWTQRNDSFHLNEPYSTWMDDDHSVNGDAHYIMSADYCRPVSMWIRLCCVIPSAHCAQNCRELFSNLPAQTNPVSCFARYFTVCKPVDVGLWNDYVWRRDNCSQMISLFSPHEAS